MQLITQDQAVFVGQRIKEERERSRLTQREVAKLLDIDVTTISSHENGRGITEKTIKQYATLFKVETHVFFIRIEIHTKSE